MIKLWKALAVSGALALSTSALAEEAAAPAPAAPVEATAEAPAAGTPPVVEVSATGDQIVKVNTGNGLVDATANLAAKCAERSAAFKTCDTMGGFKAMGCRKMAEFRYKDVECPL